MFHYSQFTNDDRCVDNLTNSSAHDPAYAGLLCGRTQVMVVSYPTTTY